MRDKSFINNGLQFTCQRSGSCCRNHGDYAYVYVNREEVARLADWLDVTPEDFEARWCTREDGWTVLRMDQPACPFLDEESRCTVYPVRPTQCATWPFWSENLNAEAWAKVQKICAGAGQGRLYSVDEIERLADANDAAADAE